MRRIVERAGEIWKGLPLWGRVVAILAAFVVVVGIGAAIEGSEDTSQPSTVSGQPGFVARADYGEAWPLTVPHGQLRCESFGVKSGEVIFTAPDGTEYGVNGTASESYAEIEDIWRFEPGLREIEARVNMSPIIEDGLAMC